jgi:phytoene dehydrogenase-like protein
MRAVAPRGGYDVLVIGAGHNGLVCAAYLAKAGRRVLVLEAASTVGGAAITQEFSPGFRVSSCAHLLHLMPEFLGRELALDKHGLEFAATNVPTVALLNEREPLVLGAADHQGLLEPDGSAYPAYRSRMAGFAATLQPLFEHAPPRLGTDAFADRTGLLRLGWQIRRLGRPRMRELLRIGAMNVYDLLQEHFSDSSLQGALAFDAVLGTNYGPRSPGTVLTLLCRLAAQGASGAGGLMLPRGGMGALSAALAGAATAAGVEIRTAAAVERILVKDDRAHGVQLRSGEQIRADTVVSNADPKSSLLGLLGAEHLDTGFVRRVHHLRTRGLTAKLHLALKGPPRFTAVSATRQGGRLLIAPSMQYLERAFNSTKYGEYSAAPAMEIIVPTLHDPALAPHGAHVLSAIVQYVPYQLGGGWEAGRQRCIERLIAALETHAPGISGLVQSAELLTPLDIEQRFHIHGGHWHHGELAFDQFFMVRPVPGATQYSTPLAGLYLCGAGAHPGGGVMGYAGRNAARRILAMRPAA